jgi:hypothetical protein
MRISRDHLIELARDETKRRTEAGDVISAYVIGSVARSEPLLGGAADIDLVLIHDHKPLKAHEVVQLSREIHLDIAHHHRALYEEPRTLRVHPWLGPALCEPVFIYDPDHFFEWAQAGARGQFHRADHVHLRARAFLRRARQAKSVLPLSRRWVKTFTRAVVEGANAVVSLSGFPAAGRRLFLELERASRSLNFPELSQAFLQLLSVDSPTGDEFAAWLPAWERAFAAAGEVSSKPSLASCRLTYFRCGYDALLQAERPEANLLNLLATWETALHTLQKRGRTDHHLQEWEGVLENLGLDKWSRAQRERSLDHYLDRIDTKVSDWADKHGA